MRIQLIWKEWTWVWWQPVSAHCSSSFQLLAAALCSGSPLTPQWDRPLWIKHCSIHDEKIYPFCWAQYLEHVEWLHAESAFLRQVHWLLGTGGDKPDHSQSLVFHLCELCVWPRLRLTVCAYFTRFFSGGFLSHSRILWQDRFVNAAFMKPLV